MSQIDQEVSIELGERSYHILIGGGLLANAASYADLPGASRALIVSNTTVAPLYAAALRAALAGRYAQIHELQLPDGEEFKNWETLQLIFDALLSNGCDRKTTIFALGGGVCLLCRSRPRCWPKWTLRWVAKRPSTTLWART